MVHVGFKEVLKDMSTDSIETQDFLKFSEVFFKLLYFFPSAMQPLTQSIKRKRFEITFGCVRVIGFGVIIFSWVLLLLLMTVKAYLKRNDLLEASSQMPAILRIPVVLIKAYILLKNRKTLKEIVCRLDSVLSQLWQKWNHLHCYQVRESYVTFKKIVTVVISVYGLLMTASAFGPWIHYIKTKELVMQSRAWLPFSENDARIFPFLYAWEMVSILSSILMGGGCDLMMYGLITLTALSFKLLGSRFRQLDLKNEGLKQDIVQLVGQHNKLMDIAGKIQKTFSLALFANFCLSSTLICISCFQLTKTLKGEAFVIKYVVHSATGLMQAFLLCYFSQLLFDASQNVADDIYKMKWYLIEESQVKNMIQLVIMEAQKPVRLSALGLVDILLEDFYMVGQPLKSK